MVRINNDKMGQVLSFVREKNGDKVMAIVNLSDNAVKTTLETQYDQGAYRELFSNKDYALSGNDSFELKAWDYLVLVKNR